jgi:hypothetical protein
VRRLIGFKQVVVSWFLNAWLAPKDSKDDANYGYGGFNALTKNGSFEDLDIVPLMRADVGVHDATAAQRAGWTCWTTCRRSSSRTAHSSSTC